MIALLRLVWATLVLGGIGSVAGVLVIAAAMGPFSPRIDVATHLAPVLAVVAAIGLLASWPLGQVAREWALAGSLVSWVACLALVAPEYLRNVGPQQPSPQIETLKIIQFNGYRGNTRVSDVVDWLISERPDIVTIQETRKDLRHAILARTGWSVAGLERGNLTIFSAKPRITMDRPPNIGPLHWVNATYPSASGPYELITVHLDWPTSRRQAKQRRQLIEMINTRPHDRLILTGDFNSTPWSYGLRQIDQKSGVIRRDRGLFSFPAGGDVRDPISLPLPILPIDHIYAGPGWATVSIRRGPRLGSDHYPVVMTLAPVGR